MTFFIINSNNNIITHSFFLSNTFVVAEQVIVPLYDYVHLQKGIRNNLLSKDLLVDRQKKLYASWDDIKVKYINYIIIYINIAIHIRVPKQLKFILIE